MASKTIEPETFASDAERARWLLTPEAIRARCGEILAAAERDDLAHFSLYRDRLPACADYVLETIRANYPTLVIPFHARWRHFVVGGEDRWANLAAQQDLDPLEQARVAFDLAVTSVLLDAGAGPAWSYLDGKGHRTARSEGLAIASLDAFTAGVFSAHKDHPLRADAAGLAGVTAEDLATAFQVSQDNPLEGLEGRVTLLQSLGQALSAQPEVFGEDGRIGNLVDVLAALPQPLQARDILLQVLSCFGGIWPGRSELAGMNLGDTWKHSAISAADGLVPFHKLSQWLGYSLIEPLQAAGIEVGNIDGLTGLAEYRNGGLLIDLGVLQSKNAGITSAPLQPGDEAIVEWRALTVMLLDELADLLRASLNVTREEFPLAKALEGGTWAAGRRIAAELREGAGPPINIISDGSVF